MKNFNKCEGKTYIGIPSGSLQAQTIRFCREAGFLENDPGRAYELRSPCKQFVFRVLDRIEMAAQVSMGVVDAGITGKDYIAETGQTKQVQVVNNMIFSKRTNNPSKLVLAAMQGRFDGIENCKGLRIATELPNLTAQQLRSEFGYTENDLRGISRSFGKTEAKLPFNLADAVTDITETGDTIRANGMQILGELFQSNPQLIANRDSISNEDVKMAVEDFATGIEAVILSEKEPLVLVPMNVPKRSLEQVVNLIGCNVSPTINETLKEGWLSVEALMSEREAKRISIQLLRLGVDGIKIGDIIYTQKRKIQI